MSNRLETVISDLVSAIREVMVNNNVTSAEFNQALNYLEETAQQKFELQLMLRNFLEIATATAVNSRNAGTASNIAGPSQSSKSVSRAK